MSKMQFSKKKAYLIFEVAHEAMKKNHKFISC